MYTVTICGEREERAYNEYDKVIIIGTFICGSVTELTKLLKERYNFDASESRKIIYTGFARNSMLWIHPSRVESVRIEQHKVEPEVRIHGCW